MDSLLHAEGLRPAGLPRSADELLDLRLEAGTITCLVGPPDSGKSSWLRCLSAIDPPAEGSLRIEGQECAALGVEAWRALRTRIAHLGGSTSLLSVMTGLANVMLPAQYHGRGSTSVIKQQALDWLERLGWSGPLDVLPAYLTRHQRCQLLLARCLMLDPVLLSIDEPLELTDTGSWPHLAALLTGLARGHGLALLVLTHDLPFAQHNADRLLYTGAGGIRTYADWESFAQDEETRWFREASVAELA